MNSLSKNLIATLVIALSLAISASSGWSQDGSGLKVTGSLPQNPLPPPSTSGPIQLQHTLPVGQQETGNQTVPNTDANQFEHSDSVVSIPRMLGNQWSVGKTVPPENLISGRYIRSLDTEARSLTLKEAIYIALRNNPALASAQLDPVAAVETIRQANGTFDPNMTAQGDIIKSASPTTSSLQTGGADVYTQKYYDWNFGINKVSAITNGNFGVTFDNERALTNSAFAAVNPSYTPNLALSLSQPLLQNFGWQFATINVRIAESGQKQAQWNYGQSLQDFVLKIGAEYWQVVLSEENLEVARAALRFNEDLVRQNAISVKVGTLAPIDLQEAQSAAATAEANVYTAEANLRNARIQLREDVMLNPYGTFIPEDLEPITRPNPQEIIAADEERALELAVQYRPSLGGLREAIRTSLLQVKFAENQVLPQLNLGTQIGINSTAGTAPCLENFSSAQPSNCTASVNPTLAGTRLPFGGIYGDALNRLWSFGFYNYAAVLTFQLPIANAVARSALAQARILYEQQRLNYRASLSQTVVDVQSSLANLYADQKRAAATAQATYYARQSLHDEQVRFRVGMATTHDLLQFQEEEVNAEGNQVQAETDLENAKLALYHSEGTLLQQYQVNWQVVNPHEVPWYAAF
ncbi:MAG TPA: TolC family protein [Candidatus Binataceae bacterium]|nr:TolC family protein [Candidatus Binataceae bacterium]